MTSLLEDWHTVSWRLVSRKQSYVLGWKGGRVQSEAKGGRERRWLGSLSLGLSLVPITPACMPGFHDIRGTPPSSTITLCGIGPAGVPPPPHKWAK